METSSAQEKIWRALEKAAKEGIDAIQSSIKSTTDPDRIRSLMAALGNVPLPPGSRLATLVASIIASAEEKLYDSMVSDKLRTESLIASMPRFSDLRDDRAFTRATYQFFNDQERRYFESIDPTRTDYQILRVNVDQNGNVTLTDAGKTSGDVLREDFARLKYHALPSGKQDAVRQQEAKEKVATAEQIEAAKKTPTLEQTKKEMHQLQESMTRLEGHEAQKTIENHGGATAEAKAEIKERHDDFKEARTISTQIIERAQKVEKQEDHVKGLEAMAQLPAMPMMPINPAKLVLPVAKDQLEKEKQDATEDIEIKKGKLKDAIQEGVINNGLLGKDDAKGKERKKEEASLISAATDVSQANAVAPKAVAALPTVNKQAMLS